MKCLCSLIMLLAIQFADAAQIEYGKDIIISKPVYGNLYVAGGSVTVNARIYGDLIVAGGNVFVNDTIFNDILIVGGKIILNGYAADDIRCAGGTIRISRNVKGDVVLGGGEVMIDKTVSIGSLLGVAGKITIDGVVTGSVKGGFGELLMNGRVLGEMDCRARKITINGEVGGPSILSAENLVVGSAAIFNHDLRYWCSDGGPGLPTQFRNGRPIYDDTIRILNEEWYYLGASTLLGLFWYLGMAFIMILVIQYVLPGLVRKSADTLSQQSVRSMAYGLLLLIAIPVCAAIALCSMIGIPLGLLLLLGYFILLVLATPIVSVVMANLVNQVYNKRWTFFTISCVAFGFFVLLKLASLAPYIGVLVMFLVVVSVFGSVLMSIPWKNRNAKARE